MKSLRWVGVSLFILMLAGVAAAAAPVPTKNFRVAIYVPEAVVEHMRDAEWLQQSWDDISSQLKVDKVYIETYRARRIADEQLLETVKKFFLDHHVQVAGGIAFTGGPSRQFVSLCYTDPADREYVKRISALTARHFDEIILDDFFFNNTKADTDIAAKGTKSWTQFRLALMDDASRELVLAPARAANPRVKVIIKYPNWYEHFQALGYDLDQQPKMFDGIYTGTETRDPVITDQQLQQYESYLIFRYFENIKPGGNGGGWVDTFSIRYVDRYAEQLWDSMFAKAPEIMLFNWHNLLDPAKPDGREAWQDQHTSFDYAEMLAQHKASGSAGAPNMATVAGYSLRQVDPIVGKLGKPIGISSYKPYQSTGEDFLHNYLGMIGIPVELYPTFPADAATILLTESAKFDPVIVDKIKQSLKAGKNVFITSGLLSALQGKGIEDIVELSYTGHVLAVDEYWGAFGPGNGMRLGEPKTKILFPEIRFITNDAWPIIRGTANGHGAPLVLVDHYSNGNLFVLTIPENFADLYQLPQPVLRAIRSCVLADFPVQLDAPAQVSLFAYDNQTFIVESFLDRETPVTVSVAGGYTKLHNLVTGETVAPKAGSNESRRMGGVPWADFEFMLQPHSYVVFAEER